MPVINIDMLSVQRCQSEPDALFVFGDNMQRWGTAGQAVIRHCQNAIGIPTKRRPSNNGDDAFFKDADLQDPKVVMAIGNAFDRLARHVARGGTVYWPSQGVGTGLAQLPQRAPRILAMIEERLSALHDVAARSEPEVAQPVAAAPGM